ncbi:MAG TPA: WD40 repeat domain-containing protein [Pirellulales bacterium]|nr:WD40 repeat domain-containing protein [Pirellulales bacterium]
MAFDPYHKWLGIPAAEQPANHYRLLAVALFEDDPDVIETAADQRMALLRTFQTGPHSADSQRLLNELSSARLCLLTQEKKSAYDADLRRRIAAAQRPQPVIPAARPLTPAPMQALAPMPIAPEAPALIVADDAIRPHAAHKRRHGSGRSAPAWAALAAVAIPAFAFIGYLIYTKSQTEPARKTVAVDGVNGPQKLKTRAPASQSPSPSPDGYAKQPIMGSGDIRNQKRFVFELGDPKRAGWSIEGDELVQSLFSQSDVFFGDPTWQDIDVSLDLKRTEGNGAAGIWFGHRDNWNANYILLGIDSKRHSANSRNDGIDRQLVSRDGTIGTDRWHRLALLIRGRSGKCFLDDEEILAFETERPPRGRVGFQGSSSPYLFRNIAVKSPEGTLLLEGLPDLDAEPQPKPYEAKFEKLLAGRAGTLPTAADGRPLNLDFETGDLRDWTAEGDAFAGQPVKGDILHARYKHLRSRHAGQFWIGGKDKQRDTGSLTSAPFKVTKPYASFLMAGDWVSGAYLELVRSDSKTPFFRATGRFNDTLWPVAADLRKHLGQEIFIRVIDRNNGTSGHVSFDDFRLHDNQPDLSSHYASASSVGARTKINVLKLLDIERDRFEGRWHWDAQGFLAGIDQRLCRLPLAIPDEYELALTVEGVPRTHEVQLNVPIGGRMVQIVLDGWGFTASGLRLVDGKDANDNETTHKGRVLLDGRPNSVVCQVRANSLKVVCNGATVIDWRGDPARLSIVRGFDAVAGYDGLLIGGPWCNYRISRIELTPLAATEAMPDAPAKPPEPSPPRPSLADIPSESHSPNLTAKEVASLKQHTTAVTRLAFHRTTPLLASAGKDGQVLLWNLQTGAFQLQLHKFREEVWAIKFSPDGSSLAYANRYWWGSRLFFKTLAGVQLNEVKDFKRGGGAVASIAYSPDGRLFAAGQDDGTIRLWDVAQFKELTPVGLGEGHNVYGLAFGPVKADRKSKRTEYLLAEGGEDGQVRTLAATLAVAKNGAQWTFQPTNVQFPKAGRVIGLRFSPNGKLLGYTRGGGHVSLCDPRTGQMLRDLAGGSRGGGSVEWIAFHAQKPWCVTAHKNDQVARIWNTDTAELLCELRGHTGGVMCAEFSPDGRQVATASEDFSIKLWDLAGSGVPAVAPRAKKPKPIALLVGE